ASHLRSSGGQAREELDEQRVHLARTLLLNAVTGPCQQDLLPQVGHHALELVEALASDGDSRVLRTGEEERRLADLRSPEKRRQLPVAVTVPIPVESTPEPG